MKSSSGEHFIALDHVRALAAFMVFTWHFTHATNGYPIPFEYAPALFPLSILDEGQTGVALFMTLSGYLFAKLLDGKDIDYRAFLWNRVLRLAPLLVFVLVIDGVRTSISGGSIDSYTWSLVKGVLYPSLPNGGWSITVEFHYYAILPFFLCLLRKSKLLPLMVILAAMLLRMFVLIEKGEVQSLAYWTIIGRVDQFAWGMMVFQFRVFLANRNVLAIVIFTSFTIFYWYFDLQGGFYQNPSYPSPRLLWVFLPTIEGIAYAIGIAWYEGSFCHSSSGVSQFIGRIGELSYSIYLLHFFFVFHAARLVNDKIMDISNFYVACLWAVVFFLLMVPVGYLSFHLIEAPFLSKRRSYILVTGSAAPQCEQALDGLAGSTPRLH